MSYKVLRELRRLQNIKQEDLAKMINVKQETISHMETGEQPIGSKYALQFAAIFKVPAEIFASDSPIVINHNFNDQSKAITNTEHYYEFEKETIHILLQKIDALFIQLQQERDMVNTERKQVLELMGKLMERLG